MRTPDVAGNRWQRAMRFLRVLGESLAWKDDRMAMALSLLSLRASGTKIADPGVVTKSWPEYFTDMASILGAVETGN
jgi:5-enolpyruvylshikimate-3-phosphate synthase